MTSKRFSLNTKDVKVLGKNAFLVGIAASLAYVGQHIANLDFGTYGALVVPVIAVIIDSAVKWAKDNTKKIEE
jgi:hypothetical protein